MEGGDWEARFEQAHKQSGWMLVFTIVLVVFLLYSAMAIIPELQSLLLIVIFLPLPFTYFVTRAYFQRKNWALPWVILIWIVSIAACFILMLIELYSFANGNRWSIVQCFLLLYLCKAMLNRIQMINDGHFRAWYDSNLSTMLNINLNLGEVLASCPHCQSLLAVNALTLDAEDLCPNCSQRLVLEHTISNLAEEE
ncbi:MAG: hypothetical protein QF440_03070 [Candidatus Thalassarchaeaceae archaeon]|jgi:uncharacterized membrane protein YhdT|nr:hypothetical protein [Candidatus Thalassarchaeaceae archaeon]